jgi:galactonate dehydratase
MKITDFKTWVVANPPPHFGGHYFIFVKLVTDSGIVGYGEVYGATFNPRTMEHMIADVCEREVMGANPFQIEQLWRRVYGRGYTLRPDLSLMGILSGIEMACWDIIGKETGRPVYDLLGGKVHERLRSYTYLYPDGDNVYPQKPDDNHVYVNPDTAAERALHYVEQGFTAVKFDPAGAYTVYDGGMPTLEELDRSERFVKRIREAVGTRADMLFGTHGQFSTAGAIRLAKRLEPYDPMWFEEPVPPENPKEMARVARQTSIPVATGERLCTKYEFARVLEHQAASILQMALGRVGGLLEAKKIAGMAETYYAHIAPHLYCGPIEGAANVQISTCSPNFLILESIENWGGFHAEILKVPMRWEDGYVIPPDAPGLGVELDEDVAGAHPWTGTELQLEMGQDPVR